MKALWYDEKLALRDVEEPALSPGEALIQVLLAGVCGTDREILKGYSGFRGIPGHEFVGRVVQCKEEQWVGKRVVGEINVACGECAWCRKGLRRHCPRRTVVGIVNRPGAFAEFVTLPVANLHEVPDGISDQEAVFVEPLAAAAEILEQMHLEPGTHVAILGDGRLGLLISQVLRQAGAEIILLGKHPEKLALARGWGVETAEIQTGNLLPASFAVVVDATGSPSGLEAALRLVEPRGTVVMKSTFHGMAQFDTAKLVVNEVTLLGSRCGNFARALELLRAGAISTAPLVSRIYRLEQGLEAFEFLSQPSCLKVLLAPSGT